MLNLTRLLCGTATEGDGIRYGETVVGLPNALRPQAAIHRRPVVVWNSTRRCNLHCQHCYTDSKDQSYPGELTNTEARAFIKDLSDYGVPVLLFSGGEPLVRPDLLELVNLAVQGGVRAVLSTNG
ncbi:MAG: radical SAM protein, partial [Dehalococcoidia bacterium]